MTDVGYYCNILLGSNPSLSTPFKSQYSSFIRNELSQAEFQAASISTYRDTLMRTYYVLVALTKYSDSAVCMYERESATSSTLQFAPLS